MCPLASGSSHSMNRSRGRTSSVPQRSESRHQHHQESMINYPHLNGAATCQTKAELVSNYKIAETKVPVQPQQSSQEPASIVELSISCKDLPDCDVITKSDPQVIVYQLDILGQNKKTEIGRTEQIHDNLNPKFLKKIYMQYHFEQCQRLRFEVFDVDPVGGNDFLGSLDTTLADIVAARSSVFKQPLVGGPKRRPGHIILEVEELTSCKEVAEFVLAARSLSPLCCGLLSPSTSVDIYRSNENGSFTIVHRSASEPRNRAPRYKPFRLKLVNLCNGDPDRTIRLELFDRRFGMERSLGYFETTINALKRAAPGAEQSQMFNLLRVGRHGRAKNKGTSQVILSHFRLVQEPTFLDYIRAGTQIHFVIAIDFTASNGDPAYADSLHYLDPMGRRLNPYESALLAVGKIIEPYDTMGMFAGFGFGANLSGPKCPPSHLFPLNGNHQHPYVTSIDQLLDVYRAKLRQVILSGPTNFAPCIQHCDSIARQFDDGTHYFVLLIVTDGIISDMTQTKRAIVEASKGPLSIIICGVGDAEFVAMDELDCDNSLLTVDGRSAERDIVQFVPMNRFIPTHASRAQTRDTLMGSLKSQQLLAEEVLREVPDQLTGYMASRGLHPTMTCNQRPSISNAPEIERGGSSTR